ncbi:replication factor-A protein [Piedraia hortae CBS 480.64]|uniref:Replication protein A subunit n=1 Tax=Piedraia hortae CBS 480.64 TaxID=1314780 RepID=A0A6A7BWP2_9PEZI|nr:replication factor-A protein [Piedraia hortae CBS 480.64]
MANSQPGNERFRVVLNDSTNFIQSMLAQQLSPIAVAGDLKRGTIIRLMEYTVNQIKDKFVLVILDLEILKQFGEPDKIGAPVTLDGISREDASTNGGAQPGNISGNGMYGTTKPQQQQPQQHRDLPTRTTAPAAANSHGNIQWIEALSPYAHRWTIKARCTKKGDIKTWHNKNGEGKLFSTNFLDDSGEIRATGFNESVDQWYEYLQEGSVYYISAPCKVVLAKKQFSNLNHDYELTFERDTVIEKAEDEGVPQMRYKFTGLADLQNVEKEAVIDCIGILSNVGDVSEIVAKTSGKPYSKRELTLVDDTGFQVRLTIWGKSAETFDAAPESVLAFKGVKVSDFGGRSLSLLSSGSMAVDPDIDEAHKLKGWYDGAGRGEQFQTHVNTAAATGGGSSKPYKTIAQINDEGLGMSTETDWYTLKATIVFLKKDNFAYAACQTEGCNKKVVEMDEGQWRCEKCDKSWPRPKYRYIMSANVADHTGQLWLSCFDEAAQLIMGMPADNLMQWKEEGDEKPLTGAFSDAVLKTFVFRCRAKMDTFQEQQRVRHQVQYANPVNYSQESRRFMEIINAYGSQDESLFVQ